MADGLHECVWEGRTAGTGGTKSCQGALHADGLKRRFSGPFFNEVVVQCNGTAPAAVNEKLLGKKIIGGLPLGKFYPELKNCMLLCATEMNKREHIDQVKGAILK